MVEEPVMVPTSDGERVAAVSVLAEILTAWRAKHAVPLDGDVRSRSDIDGFVAHTTAEFGRLDTLVTVVGGQVAFVPAVRLHETRDDDWDLVYEMNLRYVARAARAGDRQRAALEQHDDGGGP